MRHPLALVSSLTLATTIATIATTARHAAAATACTPPRLLVVLDRSSSMNGALGDRDKWSAATDAIATMVDAYGPSIAFGLMTFPHPDACGPGQLDLAPATGQLAGFQAALADAPPTYGNFTPLGETLLAAADPATLATPPDDVVVVTDGFQWCDPYDPTARTLPVLGVKRLRERGSRTFVVGFGGGVDRGTLIGMALEGGTATPGCDLNGDDPTRPPCYYQADDAGGLLAALMDVAATASVERCDGADNDCDGAIDNDAACPDGGVCHAGSCVPPPGPGGNTAPEGEALADDPTMVAGGCDCTSADPSSAGVAVAILAIAWRRRRR